MIRILLVEDDATLGATLRDRLAKEGFEVIWVRTKKEATGQCGAGHLDLCILDIGLPDGLGLDLARDISLSSSVPFIFLTAMNSAEYRLEGYELGADEFIPKPFTLKELFLLIRRVLERHGSLGVQRFGASMVDFGRMSVKAEGGVEQFPPARDFKILKLLIKSAPRPVGREEILKEFSEREELSAERSIDNTVVRLRGLFGKAGRDYIRSVRGVGYQWVAGRQEI